jgi:hypothetical protein
MRKNSPNKTQKEKKNRTMIVDRRVCNVKNHLCRSLIHTRQFNEIWQLMTDRNDELVSKDQKKK